MARFGLNLLYLIPGLVGGTERYALALLREMARRRPEDCFDVFLSREAAGVELPAEPNVRRVVGAFPARQRPLRYAWEQLVLPAAVARRGIDLLHSPGYVMPLLARCPQVVTVCDANYRAIRQLMPGAKRVLVPWFIRQSARRADGVLTLSAFAATEISEDTGVDVDRITVTHLAGRLADVAPGARGDGDPWPALAARQQLRTPYLVAFGGLNPHKNMPRLLEAFSLLAGALPHELVLIGPVANLDALRQTHLSGPLASRVRLTGWVSDAEVCALLRHAELFVFPTLYEGFGMPVVEAQELGVPVACSRVASLPEIAGDGVAFFDPLRPEEIAATVRRCLESPELRAELVRRGFQNAARFSWSDTASRTLAVYREVLARRGVRWEAARGGGA
jgi:glycosyltransferase involved in cell wall biosynthesis